MSKETLKLALEALKANYELINGKGNHFGLEGAMDGYYSGCFDIKGTNKKTEESIKALEEALAKQEQGEPFGYWFSDDPAVVAYAGSGFFKGSKPPNHAVNIIPLYTTPQQRKPLTDEEIEKCYETTGHYQTLRPQDRFAVFALARAIEAAHGIKE